MMLSTQMRSEQSKRGQSMVAVMSTWMVGGGGGRVEFRSVHIRRMDHASRTSTHTLEPRDRYRSSGIELRGNFEPRVEDTLAVAGVDVVVVGAEASVAKGKRVGISR